MSNKKKQKILIRCLTEPSKGFGHLSRCLVLSKSLQNFFEIEFLINKNPNAINKLRKKNIKFTIIPKKFNFRNEHKFIQNILISNKIDLIIFDMREYSDYLIKNLYSNVKSISLDDAWSNKAYADLIFNVTNIPEYHKYEIKNLKSKLFLGTKYYLAEENFLKNQIRYSDIKSKKKYRVTISLGGSDPSNFSFKVLKSLQNFKNISITVIFGSFFKPNLELNDYLKKNKICVVYDSPNIWKSFRTSDIVISNGGNTLFELAIMHIPTITIAMHKHQIPYCNSFQSLGFGIYIGYWKNISLSKVQNSLNLLINNVSLRRKMFSNSKKIIDGKGLSRVIRIIKNYLKN